MHVEFGLLVFVTLSLLYHLLLIAGTPGGSDLIISIKQELTCYLETRRVRCNQCALVFIFRDHNVLDKLRSKVS